MMNQQETVSDAGIIILLWRITQGMRKRGQTQSEKYLLNVQKMLHLTVQAMQKKTLKASPFNFTEELTAFVQYINKITMEVFNRNLQQTNFNIFVKAIDILMVKALSKYVEPLRYLGELKVLTFNNLACIYKRKKKFGLALKAVSFALQIEQLLLKECDNEERHNIITTYLNKAAILSQMNRHEKAIDQIKKSLNIVKVIESKSKISQELSEHEKSKRLQRQNYLSYMKMIIFYNMGVEHQHINLEETAVKNYRLGLKLANQIDNEFMKQKFQAILAKLQK